MLSRKVQCRKLSLKLLSTSGHGVSMVYYKKGLLYGNFLEVCEYAKLRLSFKSTRKDGYIKMMKSERRSDSYKRARQDVFRIVEANKFQHGKKEAPLFFTLTFRENIVDLKEANKLLKYFMKKLKWQIGENPKYIIIPEFQKRGAVHYHGVFFNINYIDVKVLEKIWGHGYIDVQVPKKIKSISAYLAKYLTKDFADTRLYGQKAYFTSRGLKKVVVTFDDYFIDNKINGSNIVGTESFNGRGFNYYKYKFNSNL